MKLQHKTPIQLTHDFIVACTLLLAIVFLSGCGQPVQNSAGSSGGGVRNVFDPDVRAFQENLWGPVLRQYCKGCHEPGGGGSGSFAHRTDIEFAHSEVLTNNRVNRTTPDQSGLVTKVGGGHNCWITDANNNANTAQCAAEMTAAINNWLNVDLTAEADEESDTAQTIDPSTQLNAPLDIAVAPTLKFPDLYTDTSFATTVYPVLRTNCVNCHTDNAQTPQSPFFAHADAQTAYDAVVNNRKVDVTNYGNSRLVLRLSQDAHNCWTNCSADSTTMQNAIFNWLDPLQAGNQDIDGDPNTMSLGLRLIDGQVLSGGTRYERNLIAKWAFDDDAKDPDTTATTAEDSSSVLPKINLTLEGNVEWVAGWGVEITQGGRLRATSVAASQKLYDQIVPRGEYSIEAWVVPNNTTQEGPAVIASYSSGAERRNFTMGQVLYSYNMAQRNTNSGLGANATANGQPAMMTDPDDEDLQATQQHVVMTYDTVNGRRFYVNGEYTGDQDTILGGSLLEWDDGYLFVLGSETNGSNQWRGKIRLMAIFNRALTQEQIQQNFNAGVGQKFNLLFKLPSTVTANPDIPTDTYVWFEVSEYDNNSYLFNDPRVITLGATTTTDFTLDVMGMRLGINGREAEVGQAFANLDTSVQITAAEVFKPLIATATATIDSATVTVPVSPTGTIIAVENGRESDQFYLTFKQIGGQTDQRTEDVGFEPVATTYTSGTESIIGLRTFEEIVESMSQITGVPRDNSTVADAYFTADSGVREQLPSRPDMSGFLASQQMAIVNMAGVYCKVLTETATYRDAFFANTPTINVTGDVATVFEATNQQRIITKFIDKMVAQTEITTQPTHTAIEPELNTLISDLRNNCATSGCTENAARALSMLNAMCMTVLSSAPVIHK